MTDLARAVAKLTAGLRAGVMLAIGRGRVVATADEAGIQRLQVAMLANEVRDDVRRVQQYGLTSHAPAGSEAVVVCVGGNRDRPLVIAVDDGGTRKRGLMPGEVAVYNARGDYLHLKADGEVELTCRRFVVRAAEAIELRSPSIDLEQA